MNRFLALTASVGLALGAAPAFAQEDDPAQNAEVMTCGTFSDLSVAEQTEVVNELMLMGSEAQAETLEEQPQETLDENVTSVVAACEDRTADLVLDVMGEM